EYGLAEAVAHVLERSVSGVARDREDTLERGVQAHAGPVVLGLVGLQERAIGIELDGEQVGRVEHGRLLAEVLADALLLGKGISHRVVTSRAENAAVVERARHQKKTKTPPPPTDRPRPCGRRQRTSDSEGSSASRLT